MQPEPVARVKLIQAFGNLKVRPKLMVLHNLFFLVLAGSIYLGVAPLVGRAWVNLFLVLGCIYLLAVLVLEIAIMPLYVYRPLQLMLDADDATRRGDREHELIPEELIPGDEIGQIMRSRNASIQELRRREDELGEALQRLEAQDRLVSLGLLSASVAHELNTPISVLLGSIDKLTETSKDKTVLERLERMRRVTQRLGKISEGLVGFSKVRKESTEPVPLRALIDEAWSLVAIDERAAAVRFENHTGETEAVMGNPDRLVQVFVNLLRNALNAVEREGRIEVRSRRFVRNAQSCVAITVLDNGPGIPPEVLPEIFDAFVSSRLDARGTGLGLTVAEGIVNQHGGTITASNRPSGGACLEVTLPSA